MGSIFGHVHAVYVRGHFQLTMLSSSIFYQRWHQFFKLRHLQMGMPPAQAYPAGWFVNVVEMFPHSLLRHLGGPHVAPVIGSACTGAHWSLESSLHQSIHRCMQ